MFLSDVIFNVPNLVSDAGRQFASKLGFAFTSFFFCFASFISNFLLIYLNQMKINLMYSENKLYFYWFY